jgi:predicted AlkP superfamily phosphohydrolase/phosphomutase
MTNNSKRNLVIIGIDGGTFKIIDPLIEEGKLPNLKRLIISGVKGILKSTYPPITAAAWVSFMTGKNPGKHGFFDFREYNPEDYIPSFVPRTKDAVRENVSTLHSSRFHGETIWDFLGNAGYEMNLVAVPMTYPPWKINGRMVAGYPCPDYTKPKTYPPEWSDEIGQLFNLSAINYSKIEEFIRECKELVERKGRIILEQIRKRKGEVYSVVFSSTDFAQHYFWKYLEQKNHSYSSVIEEIYIGIDGVIGKMLNMIDENTSIIVMSDHGFTSHPKKYFNLNSWLMQEKYISLKRNQSSYMKDIISKSFSFIVNKVVYKRSNLKMSIIEIISKMPEFIQKWVATQHFKSDLMDWYGTKAFRFRMYANVDGIVINQRGRQKHGVVEKGREYEGLRDEIIKKLLNIKDPDSGIPIIVGAFRREEIYNGNYFNNAPDIIVEFNLDYIGGIGLDNQIVSSVPAGTSNVFTGIHSQDGIFIICGPNINKRLIINSVNIIDIAPTILYDMGLPIPEDIDGKIIEEVFVDSYKANSPRYASINKEIEKKEESLTKEDEESMKQALKGLGYID